jgi:membrane protein
MSTISLSPGVIFRMLKKTFSSWSEDNAMRLSAALAFYSIFSIAPLLVIAVSVASWFGDDVRKALMEGQLSQYLGPTAAEGMRSIVDNAGQQSQSLVAGIIGVVTLLIGATTVFGELKAALNTIWEVKTKSLGIWGIVRERILSFSMILVIGFLLLISLVMTTMLNGFSGYVENVLPMPALVWGIIGFVLAFSVETLLFATIFKVLPDAKVEWRHVWIGAGVTALLFEIGKWGLSLYLANNSTASAYGAAGSFVILLLWIYYASAIIFFGAEFTQVYAEESGHVIEPSELAESTTTDAQGRQQPAKGATETDYRDIPAPARESVAYLAAPPRGYRRRRSSDFPQSLSEVPEYLRTNNAAGIVAALAGGFGVGLISRLLDPRPKAETPVEKISSGTKALALAAVPLATTLGRRLAAQAAKGLSSRAFVYAGKWLQKRFSLLIALAALAPLGALGAEKESRSREEMEKMARLQVFLDRAHFGPGKIDGRDGEFTRKALALYRKSQLTTDGAASTAQGTESKGETAAITGSKAAPDLTGLDLDSLGEVFITYTISSADLEAVGELPEDKAAQAKLQQLPYTSVAEAVAEKFHCDLKFFKELNAQKDVEALKEGDQILVPNVEPFELAKVEQIQPGAGLPSAANDAEPQGVEDRSSKENDAKKEKNGTGAGTGAAKLTLHLSTKENMLEVREGEKLRAAFPVSSGSEETASPVGEWKIKGVAKLPTFRYDEKMLKEGERSSDFHMLPPGPNSPVGVVWIALNKKGIGIHGTEAPDTIGRAASHGCVRLANWDVARVAGMVKGGVSVIIE